MQPIKRHRRATIAAFCCATLLSAPALAADVVIGVPNWPSVQATAHILKVALEDQLELEVELVDGTNKTVFDGMNAGTIHVHPEAWLPNLAHLKRQYVDGAKTIKMHPSGAKGLQAMCTTKGTAERTGLTALRQLREPEMAAKFDSDGDGRGDVWIGAAGWGSTPIEQVRARSYGYDKTMELRIEEEVVALAEVEAAIEADKDIVFFCYAPHHMFTSHDLVVLEEPAHDPSKWTIVPPSPTPGWLEKSRAGVAWETATLHVSYATALEEAQPEAAAALSKITLDTETLSAMTYALAVEGKDPAEYAKSWVEENAATVEGWFQ